MSALLLILIVLAVFSLIGGGWGYSQPGYGYWSFSPLGLLLVIMLVLFFVGAL